MIERKKVTLKPSISNLSTACRNKGVNVTLTLNGLKREKYEWTKNLQLILACDNKNYV